MIKAVLFDLDNTLIDFMRMKRESCQEAIDAMIDAGLNISKTRAMRILFELYDVYGIEDKEIFQKFLKKVKGKIDWKILSAGIVAYRKVKSSLLNPYPGVFSTLIGIRSEGVKLAIVSDAPRLRAWTRLASVRLADFFDVVVTLDDTKRLKPSKEPFLLALKRLGISPGDAMMVGDFPDRDLKGAGSLGIKTCFASYGAIKDYGAVDSDYRISSITDLLKIVRRENGARCKG